MLKEQKVDDIRKNEIKFLFEPSLSSKTTIVKMEQNPKENGIPIENISPLSIRTIFNMGLRICVKFEGMSPSNIEGETVEYQFIKDMRYDKKPEIPLCVICVYCKSVIGDPWGLNGVSKQFSDFEKIMLPLYPPIQHKSFKRVQVSAFPREWYSCFEEDNSPKWDLVKMQLSKLKEVVNENQRQELIKQQKENDERRKIAEEKFRQQEEEKRKREEAKKAHEQLQKLLSESDSDPNAFAALMKTFFDK